MKFVYSLVLSFQEFCCDAVVRRWFCPGVLQSAEKSETRGLWDSLENIQVNQQKMQEVCDYFHN